MGQARPPRRLRLAAASSSYVVRGLAALGSSMASGRGHVGRETVGDAVRRAHAGRPASRTCRCARGRASAWRRRAPPHPAQPVFTFAHPRRTTTNPPPAATVVHTTQRAAVHGLAGFFHATLYGDVAIACLLAPADRALDSPDRLPAASSATRTPAFSWFPAFFRCACRTGRGRRLDVCMWRRTTDGACGTMGRGDCDAAGYISASTTPTDSSSMLLCAVACIRPGRAGIDCHTVGRGRRGEGRPLIVEGISAISDQSLS